jgi:hypothetical protein
VRSNALNLIDLRNVPFNRQEKMEQRFECNIEVGRLKRVKIWILVEEGDG